MTNEKVMELLVEYDKEDLITECMEQRRLMLHYRTKAMHFRDQVIKLKINIDEAFDQFGYAD